MQRQVSESLQIQRLGFMGALLIDVVVIVLATNAIQEANGQSSSKTMIGVGAALSGLVLLGLALNFPSLQWDLYIGFWSMALLLSMILASVILFWIGYIYKPSETTPNFNKQALATAISASALLGVSVISPWIVYRSI